MRYLVLLSLFFLLSCRTAKKSISKTEQKESTKIESTTTTQIDEESNAVRSRKIDYEIRTIDLGANKIYPRGEIKIDSAGNFIGQADSIISIQAKISESRKKTDDSTVVLSKKDTKVAEGSTQEINTELKARDKAVQRTPSLIPYLGIGLVLLGLLWYIFRKIPSKN